MLPEERDRLKQTSAEQTALNRRVREARQARKARAKAEHEAELAAIAPELGIEVPEGGVSALDLDDRLRLMERRRDIRMEQAAET